MNKHLLLIILFLFSNFAFSQQSEYYFRFNESNKEVINTTLTRIVSIDNVLGSTVYAYSNKARLAKLESLGYKVEILPAPSSVNAKAITMATTVAQMASWNRYPTYEVYRQMMKNFETNYPTLCKLDSVGSSVQGRRIYILKISDNVTTHEAEPEFLYTSTMHGDETTGFVLLLRLADYLLSNYNSNTEIQELVNSTQIFIGPNTNPDGTYNGGNSTVANSRRYNYNNVDLNRNYPSPAYGEHYDGEQWQVETVAMMDFAGEHNFIMSANYHGGAELLNYPWDCWYSSENMNADNDWFDYTCRAYANIVHSINSNYLTEQDNGVTHGADWYKAPGSRQDYMNAYENCREVTIEVSGTKCPSSSDLPTFWNYNYSAMIAYMKYVHTGFNGTVKNENGEALDATITVLNHDKDGSNAVTNPINGDYYRPIEPGTYSVEYSANGYHSQTQTITVSNYTTAVVKNVILETKEAATLSGIVTDSETGEPLNNAIISIPNFEAVTSNASGEYSYNSIFEGEYDITVSCANYTSRTIPLTLEAGENTQNFELTLSQAESFESEVPEGMTFSGGNWTRTNSTSFNGSYCMKSATISNNGSTTMQVNLNFAEAGNISFAKKVSSESGYDFLKFYIDNSEKGSWSGNDEWSEVSYAVSAGSHTLKWTYSKDGSQNDGSDCAWVDFIETPINMQNVVFTTTINNVAQQGLIVLFNDTEVTTNSQGKATFTNVGRGNNLPYTVKQGSSSLTSGTVTIYWADVNKSVNIEGSYSVNIKVKDVENTSIEDALVVLNTSEQQTNSDGVASFAYVPYGNSLNYSVSKEGFDTYSSTISIHSDTTINVTLYETTDVVSNPLEQVRIWPNPFSSTLNISLGSISNEVATITVYNLLGQAVETVHQGMVNNELQWTPSNNIPKGIYMVVITTNKGTQTRKVIFR